MTCDLTNPIFHDEAKATAHMEADRWPDGQANCPHCGSLNIHKMGGRTQAGMFLCNDCRDKFTVRTGTIFERSHIPLHKWLLATHLVASSKKGISAHQMHRMLKITYKSAWFMCHRIREAMDDAKLGPLGGQNKVVEADETVVGGKKKNRAYAKVEPRKSTVMSLVERDGGVHSFHIANVTAKTLRPIIVQATSRKSHLMTDELASYTAIGREFAGHSTVNHSANEYVRLGGFVHINTLEGYFSILKRGIYGVYHHVSEQHLHRYLAEFDFRYSNRIKLGVTDEDRANKILKGAVGKRLTYHQPRQAAHA